MDVTEYIQGSIPNWPVFRKFVEGVSNPGVAIEALGVDWKGFIRGQRFPEGRATGSAEGAGVGIGRAGLNRLDMAFAFEQAELFPSDGYDRR